MTGNLAVQEGDIVRVDVPAGTPIERARVMRVSRLGEVKVEWGIASDEGVWQMTRWVPGRWVSLIQRTKDL